jgi:hypothetical protein
MAKTGIISMESRMVLTKKGSREGENLFALSFGILGEDFSMMDEVDEMKIKDGPAAALFTRRFLRDCSSTVRKYTRFPHPSYTQAVLL